MRVAHHLSWRSGILRNEDLTHAQQIVVDSVMNARTIQAEPSDQKAIACCPVAPTKGTPSIRALQHPPEHVHKADP